MSEDIATAMQRLEERFVAWASRRPDIRAAFVVGSRARVDHPADEWSDLDIIVVTTDPDRYLSSSDWLGDIGKPLLTFLEPAPTGAAMERRALFATGLEVDFALLASARAKQAARFLPIALRFPIVLRLLPKKMARSIAEDTATAAEIFGRGVRPIVDKDGLAAKLHLLFAPTTAKNPPTQHDFTEVVSSFWHQCLRTARHLRRGELWWAKSACDGYLKARLLCMVEWQARATHAWDYDTWQEGRFLEEWADRRVVQGLRSAFAHYDPADIRRGLLATMDLFRWLAIETAQRLGYPYPSSADERVTEWVKRCLVGMPSA